MSENDAKSVTLPVDPSQPVQLIRQYASTDAIRERFEELLGSQRAKAFLSGVVLAVAADKNLQQCSPLSIVSAALRAATMGLSVDPSTAQAYLVPFGDQCTFVVGVKGLKHLAIRTGKYRHLHASKIYDGQEVIFDPFTGAATLGGGKQSSKHIGWQATLELFTGYRKTIYWSLQEIHDHAKKYSKAYHKKDAPWQKETEKMEEKTVMRALILGWGYLDPHDQAILTMDHEEIDGEWQAIEGEVQAELAERAEQPKKAASELIADLGFDAPPAVSTESLNAIVEQGLAQDADHADVLCKELGLKDPWNPHKGSILRIYQAWLDVGEPIEQAKAKAFAGEMPA